MPGGSAQSFLYAANYCEENVWHLCQDDRLACTGRCAVFISNDARACSFRHQRAASHPEACVVWDYHVVLLGFDGGPHIYDLDCLLEFPVPVAQYVASTFAGGGTEPPLFRVIQADEFVEHFSSDRSHMRTASGGWIAPPPPWTPVWRGSNTLPAFVDMNRSGPGIVPSTLGGTVLTRREFCDRYA